MNGWLWRCISFLGVLLLAAILVALGWKHFGPQKPQLSTLRQRVADETAVALLGDLRKACADNSIRSVVLLPLAGDATGYVADSLRSAIEQSGALDLRGRPLDEKVRKQLNLRLDGINQLHQALTRARDPGVEGVIYGTVHAFESLGNGAKLDLELSVGAFAGSEVVFTRRYTKEFSPVLLPGGGAGGDEHRFGLGARVLAWAVAVLLLPVFTISFARATVRQQSNRANALALGVYSLVDIALALLMLGFNFSSWVGILLFLLAAAAAVAYNAFILSFALKLET